jgi:hypothetical protein
VDQQLALDKDGSGGITTDEIMSQPEFDSDGDGTVSEDEVKVGEACLCGVLQFSGCPFRLCLVEWATFINKEELEHFYTSEVDKCQRL